jgi:hypothetical protein
VDAKNDGSGSFIAVPSRARITAHILLLESPRPLDRTLIFLNG